MIKKTQEKQNAILLRKQGYSYNEILKKVPVSKSTLSLWLREIGLAKRHRQGLTLKRKLAQTKAQEACRRNRIEKQKDIISKAKQEIGKISRKELWLIGIALYWAEGGKQKEHNVSQRVTLTNSDPRIVLLFNTWLKDICNCDIDNLIYSIYIHRTADHSRAVEFWNKLLDIRIERVYFKVSGKKTIRKNIGESYYGLLRIDVRRSTDFNRKIAGWIQGIHDSVFGE